MFIAKTHLGNDFLHKRHSVMVEGGQIPRARVMDQHIIDRYLMRGELTLMQHRAGEYLLSQAAAGGLWATGINLSIAICSPGGGRNRIPYGINAFVKTLNVVKKRLSWFHAWLVKEVICSEQDVSGDDFRMGVLRQGLDCIADERMGWKGDPLRDLVAAAGDRVAKG